MTFEVVEGLAAVGTGERVTLRFGGGIVDDKALTISEVPRFALGDEVLALAYGNGETACPLVACQEGLVRQPDAALLDHVVAELQGLALPGTVDLDPDAPFAVRKDDPGRPPLVFPALAREARPLPDGVTRRAPVDDPAEEACLERNAHNPALPAGC